jgi:zinc protease
MTPTPLAAAAFRHPAPARPAVAAPAPPAPTPAGHLPHERYRLANGLTVVLHAYAAAPLVHVDVTYHVGSGHDAPGPTGLAHFCEHLLFEGSRHVAAGEHQRRVQAAGGTANALTDRDRTSYFQTAPAPALELLLWLEADRMGCLADTLTPAALETQRAIILQERTQTCDERAYGRAPEHVSQALYPAGHPYASLPIGARADIARLTLADVQAFLGRWYAPTNATLTIGGDFDPAEARRWVARYFGGLPAGQPAPAPRPQPAPALAESRRVVVAEAVRLPLLQVVFPTVPRYHPAAPALDALAEIIGQGKNSLLFQSLVRTQQAVQVSVAHTPGTLAGELAISVVGRPGVPLAALEAAVWAAVRAAADPAALPDALLRFANRRAAGLLGQLDSLAERVKQLASHARHLGQPDYLPTYLAELRALRPADVLRAHATYLLDRPAVLLHVLPLAEAPAPAEAAPVGPAAPVVAPPVASSARPALRDDFDRSLAPAPGPTRPLPLPSCWRDAFPNGLQLIGSARSAIPSFTLALGLPGGRRLEQAVPGQPAGLAALTAALLNEGSRRYSSLEFTAALNRLGSTIHVGAAADQTTVYVQSLSEHLPATLALLEERLLHPRFEPADFARLRQQTLAAIGQQHTQAPALADRLLAQGLYAPADVLSQPLAGTLASVAQLQLADVQDFYRRAYQPAGAVLAAVGNQSLAQFDPFLDFLHGWEAGAPALAPAAGRRPAPAGAGRRLCFLHQAGAQQAELRVGSLAPAYDATGDYYRASLVAFLLGGSPDSRLARRLRHTHGYAYSVRAGLAGLRCPAPFTVQAAVRPEAAAPALAAIWEEIAALQAGVTDEELHFLQTALRQQDARRYETNQQRAFFLLHLAQHGLPADYVHRQHALLASLRPAEVAAFATRHLPLHSLQTVVVGDGARLLPGLRAAGFEVVEMALDPTGALAPR